MKRPRLWTIFRLTWLVLALAIGVLWWRSYSNDDWLMYTTAAGTDYSAHGVGGRLVAGRYDHYFAESYPGFSFVPGFTRGSSPVLRSGMLAITRMDHRPIQIQSGPLWQWHGFTWQHEGPGFVYDRNLNTPPGSAPAAPPTAMPAAPAMLGHWHWLEVGVPWWFVEAIFCLPMMLWVWRRERARRRTKPGMCPQCGYDLRASPERCPECGRPNTGIMSATKPSARAS